MSLKIFITRPLLATKSAFDPTALTERIPTLLSRLLAGRPGGCYSAGSREYLYATYAMPGLHREHGASTTHLPDGRIVLQNFQQLLDDDRLRGQLLNDVDY
jgi:hypothetical protein